MGGEAAWCTLPCEFRQHMDSCCKRLRDNKKLNKNTTNSQAYFCYYCASVSARVLNGRVLAGNILMSEFTGSAHCYVRPPLKLQQLLFQLATCGTRSYNFKNFSQTPKCEIGLLQTWALYTI